MKFNQKLEAMIKNRTSAFYAFLVIILISIACNPKEKAKSEYYLVTRLGADTLAIEQVINFGDSVEAHVLLRAPKLRELDFGFSLDKESDVLMRGVISDGVTGDLVTTHIAEWDEDSLLVIMGSNDNQEKVSTNRDILPFIDMVHWPFDLMLENADALAVDESMEQPLWSGTRTFNFEVTRISADSMTLKHPSRGIMGVKTDADGHIALLDAGLTTRKLTVTRTENLDYDGMKAHFAELEKAGRSFGALSGRGKTEKEVNGVNYLVDFGTPEKRGREIWGGIVPYGERWRTGANRATHFTTDQDIMLGDLPVPAGEYTLFSIPGENSLTLIVNTQTGQNGRSYDESLDLGRVEMTAIGLAEPVEVFTIDIIEKDGTAYLSLQWDDKAYEVEILKQ